MACMNGADIVAPNPSGNGVEEYLQSSSVSKAKALQSPVATLTHRSSPLASAKAAHAQDDSHVNATTPGTRIFRQEICAVGAL